MLKRIVDIIISLILLLVLFPFIGIVMVFIRFNMGKPVFFGQKRPGLKGKPFTLYKFRTMSNDCNSRGQLLEDHERITKIGYVLRKLSIDEIPQLFSVLKGELSLVGPRPLLMEYLPLYNDEQARRHDAKPGMTGWAQVNGRNAITWEEKFEFDVWYVDHQSFWLDCKVLYFTFLHMLKCEGVNAGKKVTMPKFTGTNPGSEHEKK